MIDLRLGDCIEILRTLPDNSVDSIVTDPPYHLTSITKRFGKEGSAPAQYGTDGAFARASKGFMGKEWDGGDIAFRTDIWSECLRVLKPGGHLLSFGGSRTYHRMAVAIEDAGFEVRDQIMWIYGSGFPKSHNIGKAIDKFGGNNLLSSEIAKQLKEARTKRGLTLKQADELFCNGTTNYNWLEGRKDGQRIPNQELFDKIVEEWSELKEIRDKVVSSERELLGVEITNKTVMKNIGSQNESGEYIRTKGNSEWEGWGSSLKPAHEPICMARKPLSEKSIAENVLKHGTGGINIDGCRIGSEVRTTPIHSDDVKDDTTMFGLHKTIQHHREETTEGRFPANIIFDEEAGKLLDEQSGPTSQGHWSKTKTTGFGEFGNGSSTYEGVGPKDKNKEKQGASRFFYCPKVSKKERGDSNTHPTVKPQKLMEYLITLVTPKGGIVLEPFMGSGSTGIAAKNLGMSFIGIEKEQEYFDIAKQRIGE
jgi:DNA modification methylase